MLDTTEPPSTTSFLVTDPYKGQSGKYLEALEADPEAIRRRLQEKKESLQRNKPQLAEQIEAIYNLYYSFCFLPNFQEEEVKLPMEERISAARIQQTFVHHAFYAGLPAADGAIIESVYRTGIMFGRAAEILQKQEGENQLSYFWLGIKRELAVVKTLTSAGYSVWLPDYRANTDPDEDEITQFDVSSGVDLIARKGNRVVLIDVKGSRKLDHPRVDKTPEELQFIRSSLLRRTIWAMGQEIKLERAEICLPVNDWELEPRDFFNDTDRCRRELNNFCRLDPIDGRSIIKGIERETNVKR